MKKQKREKLRNRTRAALAWVFSIALVSTMMPVNALAAAADNMAAEDAAVVQEQQPEELDTSTSDVATPAEADMQQDQSAPDDPKTAESAAETDEQAAGKTDQQTAEAAKTTNELTEKATEEETTGKPAKKEDAAADYAKNGEVEAADIQGKAAESQSAAREELADLSSVSGTKAKKIAARLFEDDVEGSGEDVARIERSGDGSNIEGISAKWITEDSVDNDDKDLLYYRPAGDTSQIVRLQINYALSGEHAYEAGDITITVPAHMFRNRSGAPYGGAIIPFPEEPSRKSDFNWKLVGDTYVLTNTKRMSAATKGYIQFAFDGLIPHELVDMAVSDPFDAYIEVVTHKGNTIALRSNELTAQFDTQAKVTNAEKRRYGTVQRVPASSIPQNKRIEGEEEYIKVEWYTWAVTNANTLYDLEVTDVIPQAKVVNKSEDATLTEADVKGFLLDAASEDGKSVSKKLYRGYSSGQTQYYYFSTAYPASQFKKDTEYTFHNDITYTLTEVDPAAEVVNPNVSDTDPQLVTTKSASSYTAWSFTDPKWYDPTGHFMVVKNGNDDKEQHGKKKYNHTHRKNYGVESYEDTHRWSAYYSSGWYGIYPSALNDLQAENKAKGEQGGVRLSYIVDSVGYVMPWMFDSSSFDRDGTVASRLSKNYTRPVRMTTKDKGLSIGRDGKKLEVGKDYTYVSIEFPQDPWLYYGKPKNINPDGSWSAMHAGDGTFVYTRDEDKTHWPDIQLQIQRNGTWQDWATASWNGEGGTFAITLADGTVQDSRVVDVPKDTENFRTIVTLKNTSTDEQANIATQAAIDYDVRPVVEFKSTNEVASMIEAAFEKSNLPEMLVWNEANMIAERADVSEDNDTRRIVTIDNDGYDILRGYTTDTMVYPAKTSKQTVRDVDYENRTVTIHYTAKVEERSVINDKDTYEIAIAAGNLTAETHGIWRDLLPKGVTPDLKSVTLSPATDAWNDVNYVRRTGDRVTDAYTIENYKGSGRTMLVVECDLTPTPQRYKSGDMYYYEDVPRISFDAALDFDALIDYGERIHNVISFESSNEQMGSVAGYSGEPDDPNAGKNVSTSRAFENNAEKTLMTGLNADRPAGSDDENFVYAGVYTNVDIISAARTSLSKDVQVNNDGLWSDGLYYEDPDANKRTVYEGGQYAYRLRMMSDDQTISKDLVLYDSLENFYAGDGNDTIDIDAPHWRGTLAGVDTSQLEDMGCAPVVYYSTTPNLQLSDENNPDAANTVNVDLSNSSIWTKASEYEGSLADVKAIAVDASKRSDGKDFELDALESAVVIVRMIAPSGEAARGYIDAKGDWGDSAQAYNNAYLLCTSIDKDTLDADSDNFVRKDYTKVGLVEYNFEVDKLWDDGDDRDAIRPDSAQLQLYADGEPYLVGGAPMTITLPVVDADGNESWHGVFEHIPYTDPSGNKVRYSVREVDTAQGYEARISPKGENAAVVTNYHEPEKIAVSGMKGWIGDDDNPDARPDSITLELYGNGKYVKKQKVTPDDEGNWTYTFADVYKYENGTPVEYTVKEKVETSGKGASYVASDEVVAADGTRSIVNVYHPFGNVRVTKNVVDATNVSAETLFPFTFEFTREVDGEDVPLADPLDYAILNADGTSAGTGTMTREDRTVQIKGGQTICVQNIPEYVNYKVSEGQQAGFEQTASSSAEGTVAPNRDQNVVFENTYAAKGQLSLQATKRLTDHEMKRYQFRFELYEVAEDGTETLVRTGANARPDTVQTRDDGTVEYSEATVAFGALRYTQADAGKTFTYHIKETNAGKLGYTYDSRVYTVHVSVVDNGDGTLTVTPTYSTQQPADGLGALVGAQEETQVDEIRFENNYNAQGQVTLRAWKDLQGAKLANNQFTFDLLDEAGNAIQTKKNTADGAIVFDAISYNQADVGKTYRYSVREVAGTETTVNYDTRVFGYTVKVLDNGDGTLSFDQGYAKPVFESVDCDYCSGNGKHEVLLWVATNDGSELPEAVPESVVAAHDQLLMSSYGGMIGRTDLGDGFSIAEFNPSYPGVLDAFNTIFQWKGLPAATAEDALFFKYHMSLQALADFPELGAGGLFYYNCPECNGSGKIEAMTGWDTDEGELPVFTNTLKDGFLAITKTTTDAASADPNQEFTFHVKLIGEGIEDDEYDVKLKANETYTSGALPAGTAYQVREDTPDGWVLVSSSNVGGTIKPLETSTASFTNKYQPASTTVQFTGTKTIDGQAAIANEFRFRLSERGVDSDTQVTTINARGAEQKQYLPLYVYTSAGGFFQFPVIVYGPADVGTHTYEITEMTYNYAPYEYDLHTEVVTVEVAATDDGKLTSTVTYDDDGIKFANKTAPGALEIKKDANIKTEANKDDVFTFKVTFSNEKGLPLESENGIEWYTRDKDGNVVMPADEANASNEGQDEGTTPNASLHSASLSQAQTADAADDMTMLPAAPAQAASDASASEATGVAPAFLPNVTPMTVTRKAASAKLQGASDGTFHAEESQLVGDAYAVLVTTGTHKGELIFFRSEEELTVQTYVYQQWSYNDNVPERYKNITRNKEQTVTINGEQYTGYLFANVEDTHFTKGMMYSMPDQWGCYGSMGVTSVRVADGHVIRPKSMAYWFANMNNIDSRSSADWYYSDNFGEWDAPYAPNYYGGYMSSTLRSFDMTGFDTSQCESFQGMFLNCKSLTSLDLSSFDTSAATNMSRMFYMGSQTGTSGLTTLNVSNFDTSNVTNMDRMFYKCSKLKVLDIESFDTENVSMTSTFEGTLPEKVILGPNFRFNTSTIPNGGTDPYTGKWTREDGSLDEGFTPADWSTEYDLSSGDLAGVWVWELPSDKGVVRFDAMGGSFTGTQQITATSADQAIAIPGAGTTQRLHYKLVGWNTAPDGSGTTYECDTTSTTVAQLGKIVTLYAQWEADAARKYSVSYWREKNSGSYYSSTQYESWSDTAPVGTDITITPEAVPGFVTPEPLTKTIADDDSTWFSFTYYLIKNTIVFDGNGADAGQMTDMTVDSSVSKGLSTCKYTKQGSIFTGWNTEPDGSGTAYTQNQSVGLLSQEHNTVIKLYAQWMENPNELLEPQTGTVYVNCKYDETIVFPNLPADTKYTIEEVNMPDGWTQGYTYGESGSIYGASNSYASFTNNYNAEGQISFTAHKRLNVGSAEEGQFTFVLQQPSRRYSYSYDDVQRVTNGPVDKNNTVAVEDGDPVDNPWKGTAPVEFEPVTFTQNDIGRTFQYRIYESYDWNDATYTYDTHYEYINVTVEDAGHGALNVTAAYDEDGPVFDNVVNGGELKITKGIVDAPISAKNRDFRFKVELADANGNPLEGEYAATRYIPDTREKQFVGYAHTSNVDDEGIAHGSYDDDMWESSQVSFPGASSLHVNLTYAIERGYDYLHVRYSTGGGESSFYADYTGEDYDDDWNSIPVTTEFDVPGDTVHFVFESDYSSTRYGYYAVVTPGDGYGTPGEMEDYMRAEDAGKVANGSVVSIKPGEEMLIADIPGGATYKVTEVDDGSGDWALDSHEGDNGTIGVAKTSTAAFTNRWVADDAADGRVQLSAHKVFEGGVIGKGQFNFELLDAKGDVIQSKTTDSYGSSESDITFDPIPYTVDQIGYADDEIDAYIDAAVAEQQAAFAEAEGDYDSFDSYLQETVGMSLSEYVKALEKEAKATLPKQKLFTYTVRETASDSDGIGYDATQYEYRVLVKDVGGVLEAQASVWEAGGEEQVEAAVFTNVDYDAKASVTAAKELVGAELADGEFAFTLKGIDGAPMPEGTVDGVATARNAADGTVNFGEIFYEDPGTYKYEVAEVVPAEDDRIAYDERVRTVTVTVSGDVVDGELATKVEYDELGGTFVNSVIASTDVVLSGTKTITGRDFKEGDSATMKIEAATEGAPMPEVDEVTVTPTSGTSIGYEFGPITFRADAIGAMAEKAEFTYRVTEAAYKMEGVEKGDDTVYEVTVTVSMDEDGKVVAEATENASKLDFVNPYTPSTELPTDPTPMTSGETPNVPLTPVDESETPTASLSDDETPLTGLDTDEDTPKASASDDDGDDEVEVKEVTVIESDTPTSRAVKTGEAFAGAAGIVLAAALAAGALALIRRRREDE